MAGRSPLWRLEPRVHGSSPRRATGSGLVSRHPGMTHAAHSITPSPAIVGFLPWRRRRPDPGSAMSNSILRPSPGGRAVRQPAIHRSAVVCSCWRKTCGPVCSTGSTGVSEAMCGDRQLKRMSRGVGYPGERVFWARPDHRRGNAKQKRGRGELTFERLATTRSQPVCDALELANVQCFQKINYWKQAKLRRTMDVSTK